MNTPAAYDPQRILEISSFRLTPKGLEPIGNPTLDQWLECGKFLQKSSESIHFLIGDWLNYGDITYGETYRKAAEDLGFSVKTLQNDKQIADDVPPERRRPDLSFSHHKLIAKLDEDEQEEYLQKAAEAKMSTREFEAYIKKTENPFVTQSSPRGEDSGDKQKAILNQIKDDNIQLLENLKQFNFETLPIEERIDLFIALNKTAEQINFLTEKYANSLRES